MMSLNFFSLYLQHHTIQVVKFRELLKCPYNQQVLLTSDGQEGIEVVCDTNSRFSKTLTLIKKSLILLSNAHLLFENLEVCIEFL